MPKMARFHWWLVVWHSSRAWRGTLPCAAVGDSVFALGTGFHHNPCCLYCCHHRSPATAPSFAVQPSQHNTEKKKEKARRENNVWVASHACICTFLFGTIVLKMTNQEANEKAKATQAQNTNQSFLLASSSLPFLFFPPTNSSTLKCLDLNPCSLHPPLLSCTPPLSLRHGGGGGAVFCCACRSGGGCGPKDGALAV